MNRSADFKIEKIADCFYVVRNTGSCNIGFCVKDNAALMIDSGYLPETCAEIIKQVEHSLNCRIELLFNTHYHADHTFGNQSVNCPILASEQCLKNMQACLSTHWAPEEIEKEKESSPEMAEQWNDLRITFPDRTFEDEMEYDFHGLKTVFSRFGGHTGDSSCAFFPGHWIIFAGDLVFGKMYPTLLEFDGDPPGLVRALNNLIKLDTDIIIPGHGEVCGKEFAAELADYWKCLIDKARDVIIRGLSEEEALDAVLSDCRLRDITYVDFRHKRNVNSVWKFFSDKQRSS
jgi:glyoxylase-like metal-dependent hydrolase (beta-lactamase superfamily II)